MNMEENPSTKKGRGTPRRSTEIKRLARLLSPILVTLHEAFEVALAEIKSSRLEAFESIQRVWNSLSPEEKGVMLSAIPLALREVLPHSGNPNDESSIDPTSFPLGEEDFYGVKYTKGNTSVSLSVYCELCEAAF